MVLVPIRHQSVGVPSAARVRVPHTSTPATQAFGRRVDQIEILPKTPADDGDVDGEGILRIPLLVSALAFSVNHERELKANILTRPVCFDSIKWANVRANYLATDSS